MYSGVVTPFDSSPDVIWQQAYIRGLEKADTLLRSMLDEIEEYWEADSPTTEPSDGRMSETQNTGEIFVVRGRDEGTKALVARLLEKMGFNPVILSERSNQGHTTIEKFERHARVGFAVVLLTPDDVGSLKGEDHPRPRARQNVIFELGFFIGRLGRSKVCALTKGQVEIPSDYAGVVYIALDDNEGWKLNLIQELQNAGFDVDANQATQT